MTATLIHRFLALTPQLSQQLVANLPSLRRQNKMKYMVLAALIIVYLMLDVRQARRSAVSSHCQWVPAQPTVSLPTVLL